MSAAPVEDLLRRSAPRVLAGLVRRHGQFDACEDAVQEALLAAAVQWPAEGVPQQPQAWLTTVATRALVDQWRADSARRRREVAVASDPIDKVSVTEQDDTLALLFLCCHPALTPPSQLALTLRAVGGLATSEIAAALLVPEATVGKRITRAKHAIRAAGARFELPDDDQERARRLTVVQHVLYLIFNEGYTASEGAGLQRRHLTTEAIRLARLLYDLTPGDCEVAGLLALMLLTDARRAARVAGDGSLIPLDEQCRELWDKEMIAAGQAILTGVLGAGPVGPYQLQAAIAALHDEAATAEETDWPQILALYDILERVSPSPMVTLSRAVAVAKVKGPCAGLAVLGTLGADGRMAHHHRLAAVRAHLLEQTGDAAAARESCLIAATLTASLTEQRYLAMRAARLLKKPWAGTDP